MTASNEKLDELDELDERIIARNRLPAGELVWVQCEGFRTLATLDKNGRWRAFYNGELLSGIVRMLKNPSNR